MPHDGLVVAAILVVNLIVAVVYLVAGLFFSERPRRVAGFVLMLSFPLVGVAVIGLGRLMCALLRLAGRKPVDLGELSFDKRRMNLAMPADVQRSLNTVAVEEALIMANTGAKRQAFIDVLKADDQGDLKPTIRRSVENADPEIAHYAASYVASALVAFKNQEAACWERLQKGATPDRLRRYITQVEEMVSSKFFAQLELGVYAQRMVQAAETLWQAGPDAVGDAEIARLVEALGATGMEQERRLWVERARARTWTSLVCLKLCAAYYFEQGDRASLFELLEEAKRHAVSLDQEALGWIRTFKTEALR